MIYYVDNIKGHDDNEGSKNNPVATIAAALNLLKASKESGIIILKESTEPYILYSLVTPMNIKYDVVIIGEKRPTVNIQYCVQAAGTTNNAMFINLILQPHTSFSGDTRALLYITASDQTYYKRFYNCLFQTNEKNYPSAVFTYGTNSGSYDTKIYYTNCTFNGRALANGTQHLNYCAYNVSFSNVTVKGSNNVKDLNAENVGYKYYDNLKNDYPEYYKIAIGNVTSQMIKNVVLDTIKNNELMQKHVMSYTEEAGEETTTVSSLVYNSVHDAATLALK